MQRDSFRHLLMLVILLLGGAALLILRPDLIPLSPSRKGNTWVVDIDTWRRTPYQRIVLSPYDFSLEHNLTNLPLRLEDWKGIDVPQTNLEVYILLEPEQYVNRKYTRPDGRFLWLSLIGSRKERSFHPSEICYIADGWQTEVASQEIPLKGGSIRALEVTAHKGPWTHKVLYFYIWPNTSRDLSQGVVMLKVTAPLQGDEAATLDLEKGFIRMLFPQVVGRGNR